MSSIVVGLLGVAEHEPALDFAVEEALRRRLPLQVLHAVPTPPHPSGEAHLLQARDRAGAALARAERRVPAGRKARAELVVREGDPVELLLAAAEEASLLVVGSRGPAPGRSPEGSSVSSSVSTACLHGSTSPVAVVPHHAHVLYDKWLTSRVVVALDGSPASETALEWAAAQAHEWSCTLTPVVVSDPSGGAPQELEDQRRRAGLDLAALVERLVAQAGAAGLEVRPRLLAGEPAQQLLRLLDPADLLVLGASGHLSGGGPLLGSTSGRLAQRAPSPVVVVRAGQARREVAAGVPPVLA